MGACITNLFDKYGEQLADTLEKTSRKSSVLFLILIQWFSYFNQTGGNLDPNIYLFPLCLDYKNSKYQ